MNRHGLESVGEVRVETNTSSARDKTPVSIIVNTRSGANQLRGSLYDPQTTHYQTRESGGALIAVRDPFSGNTDPSTTQESTGAPGGHPDSPHHYPSSGTPTHLRYDDVHTVGGLKRNTTGAVPPTPPSWIAFSTTRTIPAPSSTNAPSIARTLRGESVAVGRANRRPTDPRSGHPPQCTHLKNGARQQVTPDTGLHHLQLDAEGALMLKFFTITERVRLRLDFDVFNLINTSGGTCRTPGTSHRPRQVQVNARGEW